MLACSVCVNCEKFVAISCLYILVVQMYTFNEQDLQFYVISQQYINSEKAY